MSDTFVVIWRHSDRARWHVQPFIHNGREADRVGGRLIAQFGGEAWCLPITVPPRDGEDASDLAAER